MFEGGFVICVTVRSLLSLNPLQKHGAVLLSLQMNCPRYVFSCGEAHLLAVYILLLFQLIQDNEIKLLEFTRLIWISFGCCSVLVCKSMPRDGGGPDGSFKTHHGTLKYLVLSLYCCLFCQFQ